MFSLNEKQQKELVEWLNAQKEKEKDTYIGAIGGMFTYSFTPTTLGTIIKVTNNVSGSMVDLSDYDSW